MDASLQEVTGVMGLQGPCAPVSERGPIVSVDVKDLKERQQQADECAKCRCYWFVVWPESLDMSKFFEVLRRSGYAIAVSPLHDRDVRDDTGEFKKAHYHVLVRFPTARYLEPVRRLVGSWIYDADGFLAKDEDGKDVTWYVRPAPDYAGALRYLCHIDNPEKARYPENEVLTFGFIDVSMLYAKSAADDVESYYQLIAWCRKNPHRNYADLMDAVFDGQDKALMRTLTRYSYTIKAYMGSRRED